LKKEKLILPRIPVSTYRLQFNKHFKFSDAREIVCYLHDLGITDAYSSPYFKAKEGSLHGYDIVDPNLLNPEIGTEKEYNAFIAELHRYKMGQILDIVPNHMCIESKDNLWWMDILENGPSSMYADYFDIDWDPLKEELKEKILIPFLGDQYGNILEAQDLKLTFEEGAFFICYYENKFPVLPKTYTYILEYRLDFLKNALSDDDPHFIEFLSIITALDHLPFYIEKDSTKIAERYREKEIIKKRLRVLYNKSSKIKRFIDENIRIFNGIKDDPASFDLFDELLRRQVYRLSYWRVATEEINYRRFFDINSLAAIRIENSAVFEATHRLIMRFIGEGKVNGLRVDHPDGLYNPVEYFCTLQRNCFLNARCYYRKRLEREIPLPDKKEDIEAEILKQYDEILSSDPQFKPFYIVGEKILIKDEKMPEDWPIFSTTGYVFLNIVNGIFIKTENAKAFDDVYAWFIKEKLHFPDLVYKKKKLIMQVAMSSETNTLARYLNKFSEKYRHTRDFTLNSLLIVITEVVAFFPVYRTYIDPAGVNERDRRYIELAVSKAKRRNPAISSSIFDFLKNILLLNYPSNFDDKDKKEWMEFVCRFQQITGPVMAKGLEDTVFYVYNRFVSLNEVGGSPARFGISLETFHGKNMERMKFWPHALITTTTHDTKRSEDVRARLNVLSEIPEEWRKCLNTWRRFNRKKKPVVEGTDVPDRNEEYFLYQTLIGAWPVKIQDKTGYDIFKNRIKNYMLKSIREAKVNTSWINPNTLYEDALMLFIESIMNNNGDNQFIRDFMAFQGKISQYGMFNSLSQTLLKITSPGVPDFYQGTEIWDFSLVDPDNRQPVDYSFRVKMLEELKKHESEVQLHELARDLTVNKETGIIKLYLTYRALNYRKRKRKLFERGKYLPLEIMGKQADNACAFFRKAGNSRTIITVPRFLTQLLSQPADLPLGEAIWGDSFIVLPVTELGARYRNIFTDELLAVRNYKDATTMDLSEVFLNFPVAMMERIN